ncbi:MAG: U32 family peptidase, partial [Planctomycetes bacterium]|nr:U32 family peptidase [Planctomycetota bacterium]
MSSRARKPEVLAPAGSPQALVVALQHGADAVYFGLADGFNARARAANFSLAELPAICARVHRAGARAYLTLNTLVFEPELPAVERVLRAVAAGGVDALIVQDPAVCLLARAICPELELHASTQMTIAEPAAAEFAAGLGVTRVVVPRELSVDEIRQFAGDTRLELEVFVHGALCVSWSGQCLTSEAWGGRSANRGQCAQSCRMPYDLVVDGAVKELGDVRYLLSPKDLAGAGAVPDLLDVVHGLKIEGRQKGPQYVATAVSGYRRWVDALATGADRDRAERQLADDLLAMSLSYTRGFGDGFLAGRDHQTLVDARFPKSRGHLLGEVLEVRGATVIVGPVPEFARAGAG